MSGAYWNELDFEKLGADCHLQTNALYGNPVNSSEASHTTPSDPCDAYHDYRFEWTPEYIAWFIDGRELRRNTGAIAAAFAQNATAGMTFHFNVWPGNASFGGNFNPASLPVRQYISSVQYSSYQNGNFVVAWREEFDGPSLPSGWAVGNWASPYALSTHNAANVTFTNGIAVLSLTADGMTGYTGVPPADPGSTGGTGGAGGAGAGGAGTGGMATGGATMGGSSTGGATMGGSATGGATVGGSTAGGAGGSATSGASGMQSTGGAATAGAVGAGGATPSGGSGTSGDAGSAGDATPTPEEAPNSGCGCRAASQSEGSLGAATFVLVGLALVRSRRVRFNRRTRAPRPHR
jgi:MYXO-CTERM domain-containing protein